MNIMDYAELNELIKRRLHEGASLSGFTTFDIDPTETMHEFKAFRILPDEYHTTHAIGENLECVSRRTYGADKCLFLNGDVVSYEAVISDRKSPLYDTVVITTANAEILGNAVIFNERTKYTDREFKDVYALDEALSNELVFYLS